jgi:hypothetical protein
MFKSFILLALVITITGCGLENTQPVPAAASSSEQPNPAEPVAVNWESNTLQQVNLSRSKQFGQANPALLGTFTRTDDMKIFVEAFRTAVKMSGQLDIRKPDYDMTLIAEGTQESYHLWLDPRIDSGLYTSISDTGTGYELTEEMAGKLRKLIAELSYSPEQAVNNGDVVDLHGKITNLNAWDRFRDSLKSGTRDEVHITSYTTEGDPIFYDLYYDGNAIEYSFDNTKDAFGSPQKTTSFCKTIDQQKVENGNQYTLGECDSGKQEQTFFFSD